MKNLCILDIGSHKAEEVRLFEGFPNWTARNRLRILRSNGFRPTAALREIGQVNDLSQAFKTAFRCRYVLVEPIMHPELLHFVEKVPSILVGGVSSCQPSGVIKLLMANDSLGNSIVPSKPGLSGAVHETFNVDFADLYEFVARTFIESGDCAHIILRINAEGVEGPIIEYLAEKAPVKPAIIAGSLGDIRKCFGEAEYEQAMQTLEESNIPFVRLTSHPGSWAAGLDRCIDILAK
jgi:hypothetical protein